MATSFTPITLVAGTLLGGSIGIVYTVPQLTSVQITQMTVTNTDTSNHSVTIYLASNSTSPGRAQQLAQVTLTPGQCYSVYQALGQVLSAGATIQASADIDGVVNIKASGVSIV